MAGYRDRYGRTNSSGLVAIFYGHIWYIIAVVVSTLSAWVIIYRPEVLSKNTNFTRKREHHFFHYFVTSLVGILFLTALIFLYDNDIGRFWLLFLGFGLLFFTTVTDIKYGIIPNRILAIFILVWFLCVLITWDVKLISNFFPAGSIMLLVFCINRGCKLIINKEAFGYGDLKLLGVLGLFFGWQVFWIFYLAIVIGAILGGLYMLIIKKPRYFRIVFAPMLFAGASAMTTGVTFEYIFNYIQILL